MNLIGDPWVPVAFQDGQSSTVGLNDLYEQAAEIRDLALAPPQRIAVMRLLICITQAALDGPKDKSEWLTCKSHLVPKSLTYLDTRKTKFDLFGDTPFMQIRDLATAKESSLDKLDFGLASGNNKTLFDQSSTPEGRIHSPGWASLQLLTFLNFSTGGKVGQVVWCNQKFSGSTKAASALGAAHLFLRRGDLCETIWLNLLAKDEASKMPGAWGKPVWDAFPQDPDDKACIENATQTYLGRLVPLTRLIKLNQMSPSCMIGPPPKSLEFEGPPSYREPSATVIADKKKYRYLRVSVEKHIWRDLGSVLVLHKSDSNDGGAMTIENLRNLRDADQNCRDIDIWVGGLLPSRAAIEDAVEWNLTLPVSLLGESELNKYQINVDRAEKFAKSLSSAVRAYLDEMKAYKGGDIVKRATSIFWQELDQRHKVLFEGQSIDDEWKGIVRGALSKAYEQSCVRETPRQIQAFVAGQKCLELYKLRTKGGKNGRSK